MLTLDNMRMNIDKANIDISEVSGILFGKRLNDIIYQTEEYGRYGPSDKYTESWEYLKRIFLETCECLTILQNKDRVRIQVMEKTSDENHKDIKIFIDNELVNRSNYTDYNYYRMYFYLIPYYEMPLEKELLNYRKNMNK